MASVTTIYLRCLGEKRNMDELLAYLKAKDARQELEQLIAHRNYDDPNKPDFALNPRTRRLGYVSDDDSGIAARKPLVVFSAFPDSLKNETIDTSDDSIWQWLDPNARRYEPMPGSGFLRGQPQAMQNGIIVDEFGYSKDNKRVVRCYLALERSGIVELGLGDRAVRLVEGRAVFLLTPIVGWLWQFLGFTCDCYARFGRNQPFTLVLCLRATEDAWLGAVADGWLEPLGDTPYRPECWEPCVQIRIDGLGPQMTSDEIANLTKGLATRIDNAWGQRFPRCYVHANRNSAQPFDRHRFSRYF